ncbi:MAG TPA: AI-2E family transporter [Chthoniobacterales bacterium]|nr:AI-2E family transporter [Chthoniobacterales bacterium]
MIAAVIFLTVLVATRTVLFLQPLLVPFAIAGVLSYLLEPVVSWLARRGLPRLIAVIIVFAVFVLGGSLLFIGIGPSVSFESQKFFTALPGYLERSWGLFDDYLEHSLTKIPQLGPQLGPRQPDTNPAPSPPPDSITSPGPTVSPIPGSAFERYRDNPYVQQSLQYLKDQLPALAQQTWTFIQTSLTGVFGVFGYVFGLFIVPIYLFFFLKESPRIASSWSNFLPIRNSEFKDEVVTVLTEINGYLIAFFRGQLVVSLIDGTLVAAGLSIVGLQFGFLIGIFLAFIGIIPYVGYVVCYVPAMIIAFVQFNDFAHPFWVTVVFVIVSQIDGMVVAPRVVGNSVGLHPITVIFSVFFWTLVFGGLVGAVLAIPLTATVKVLMQRYVWERRRNLFFDKVDPKDEDSEIEIAT